MALADRLEEEYAPPETDEEGEEEESPGLASFAPLADFLGISEEDQPDAYVAFKKAVMACMPKD